MSAPTLVVVENRTNPRATRYEVYIEEAEGSAIVGSGPTERDAVVDALANLSPILTALRSGDFEIVTLESVERTEYEQRRMLANPC